MVRSSSLTSSSSVSDALTTVSHHHPTSSASTPTSGLVPQPIVSPGRVLQPFSTDLPFEPLVGYSSSDEGSEQKQTQSYKTEQVSGSKTPDSRKRKSLEFTYSESEISDAATSKNQQHLRKRSPTVSQRATRKYPQSRFNKFARIESGQSSATSNMRGKNTGINSLTFGADISRSQRDARKRPLTPTAAPATAKRLKKGPFIDDSGGESDEGSQDGRGSDNDYTVTARQVPPGENSGRTKHRQKFDDKEHKLMPPGSNFQQREQDQVAKQQHSYPFAAKTILPAQKGGLNTDRLKILIAKKQGGGVVQGPEQQRMPSPMARGVNSRTQSFGVSDQVEIAEKRRDMVSSVNEATRFTSIGQQVRPPTPNCTSSTMQGRPNTTMRGTAPNSPFLNSKAPPTEAKTPSDTTRGSSQRSLSSQNNTPEQINRYRASGVCCSDTPTVRAANTPQPRNAPSSSSLRNRANVANSKQSSTTREKGQVEVGKKRERTERSSTLSTKNAQRPEVGARYGHTLTQKRSDEVEKVSANALQTPMATTDIKSPQNAVLQVQPPRPNLTSSRTRAHDQVPALNSTSVSRGSLDSQISANRPKESTPPEKKEAGYVAPIARLTPSRDRPVPTSNPSARINSLSHAGSLNRKKGAAAPASRSTLPLSTNRDHIHDNQGSAALKTHYSCQEKISNDAAIEASANASCSTNTQNVHTSQAHKFEVSSMDGSNPSLGETMPLVEGNVAVCSGASGNMTSTETPAYDSFPVTKDGSSYALSSSPIIASPTHGIDPRTTLAVEVGHHSRNASPLKTFEPLPTSTEPHTQPEIPLAMMVHLQPTAVSTPNPTTGEVYAASEALDYMDVCIADQTSASAGPLESSPLLHKDRQSTDSSGGLAVVSTNDASQSESMHPDLDQLALKGLKEDAPPLLNHGAKATLKQVAGSSEVLKDVYGKNTSPATSSGERNPAGSTQPESTMAALTEESTQKVVPKSDVAIQRPTFSLLEPATKSTPSPTAPTINTQADPDSNTVNNLTLPAEITLPSPTTLPTAKPYFEYSIHQTLSSSSASTPVPLSTELTAHPLTSPDAANAQLETLFHNTRDSFNLLDLQSTRTTHSFDEHGLATYEAAFTSIEDQSKVLGLKIWVSRNTVGVHANYTPSTFAHARLVSRTVYLLCLSRLVPAVPSSRTSRVSSPSYSSSSSSGDDNDDDNLTNPQTLRIHHPLPSLTAALHTTLDAANRAARRVQIALSHEREPRGMQVQWQTKDLQELDERLERLRRKAENDGAVVTEEQRADSDNIKEIGDGNATAKGCWISTFNGLGLGSDKFQLRIEAVRLVGPRNL